MAKKEKEQLKVRILCTKYDTSSDVTTLCNS